MQSLAVLEYPATDFLPEIENDMAITVATLEERVNSHIKFFWVVVGFGFAWLSGLTVLMWQTNSSVNRVEKAQADATVKIVATLLSDSENSTSAVTSGLSAASAILQSSKVGQTKPDPSALAAVAARLSEVQDRYPELPQVWQTTGAFINYKSEASVYLPRKISLTKGVPCKAQIGFEEILITNCDGSLEDFAEDIRDNTAHGKAIPFTFIHCIVHYSGGAIPAKHLVFKDCSFEFHVPNVPPREGIFAMRQLTTAKDEAQITLSLS